MLGWEGLVNRLEQIVGKPIESLEGILLLIGVQELGKGIHEFTKEEKQDLIHIAMCKVLEPKGHYQFLRRDFEGWPHYELIQPLPRLSNKDEEAYIKESIIAYFDTILS